ncbi:hypothetical protein BX600DRAFT_468500 [Xylariales sp. PMI_506]|nr:hypothetical protein BX600DRAFT_468500 [Xylariales sp. PMI_506]
MQLTSLAPALLALSHASLSAALPSPTDAALTARDTSSCTSPTVRKEWRTLTNPEKLDFISAVKCLQALPPQTDNLYAGALSRYDDFQALHISQTDFIHWVGFFLPWHRNFLWLFEQDLKEKCGYTGGAPYWDWRIDAVSEEAFVASPLFDPDYGFGGNGPWIANVSTFPPNFLAIIDIPGRTGGGCIEDGPFAGRNVSMGPGNSTDYTPHCLRRDFSPWLVTQTLNSSVYDFTTSATTYFDLEHRSEGLSLAVEGITLHGGGHLGVGGDLGEMSNTYSSPGDPLFYLHHGGLDKMWNEWQRQNWTFRSVDIGGPDTQWAYPYNYFGDIPYQNVTLDFVMHFGEIDGDREIREVMDTQGGRYCYTYE